MTPEELNRAMEFIIESQARLAAAQEQDRQDRIAFQEWSKALTERVVRLQEKQSLALEKQTLALDLQSQALELQSRRLDRQDKFYSDSLQKTEEFQTRVLHLLNTILDRLPPQRPPE
jgi:hypothetical protein